MPELTGDKLIKVMQIAEKRGMSLRDQKVVNQIAKSFLAGEKDETIRERSRAMLNRAITYANTYESAGIKEFRGVPASQQLIAAFGVDQDAANASRITPESLSKRVQDLRLLSMARNNPEQVDEINRQGDIRNANFRGGTAGKFVGTLAGGVMEPFSHLPFVGKHLMDDVDRAALNNAASDLGGAGTLTRIVGNAIPTVATGGAITGGLTAAGMGVVPATAAAFGTVGALTAPEGERVAGAAFGAAGGAAGASLNLLANSVSRGLATKALGTGLNPSAARVATARFIPAATRVIADTVGMGAFGVGEAALRGFDTTFQEQFLGNLAVIGAFQLPRARRAFRGTDDFKIRVGQAQDVLTPGEGVAFLTDRRAQLMRTMPDHVAVDLAYRKALQGKNITPQELRMLERGGPELVRRTLVDTLNAPDGTPLASNIDGMRRVQELFKQDVTRANEPIVAREGAEAAKAGRKLVDKIGRANKQADRLESAAGRTERNTQRKALKLDLEAQNLEGRAEAIRASAADDAKLLEVRENAIREGRRPERTPREVRSIDDAQKLRREKADKRAAELRAESERLLAELPEAGRLRAEAENAPPARKAKLLKQADRIAKNAEKASALEQQALRLTQRAGKRDDRLNALRERSIQEDRAARADKVRADREARLARENDRAAKLEAQAAAKRGEAERLVAESQDRIAKINDRVVKLRQDSRDRALDAFAKVLPDDSAGARVLENGTVAEVSALFKDLREFGIGITPGQKIRLTDLGTDDGVLALQRAIRELPSSSLDRLRAEMYGGRGALEFDTPNKLDNFSQIESSFRRLMPHHDADQMLNAFRQAQFLAAHRASAVRQRFADQARRYAEWLSRKPQAQREAAMDRLVSAKEGSRSDVRLEPVESQMLELLHSLFGERGYRGVLRRMKESGDLPDNFGLRGDEYFTHIFEHADAAQGMKPRFANRSQLSRFLKQRSSNRKDFSRDIFSVVDAYITSIERTINWAPVERMWKQVQQRAAARGHAVPDVTVDFVNRHIDSATGRTKHGEPIPFLDPAGNAILRVAGKEQRPSPTRDLLRAWTQWNYIGAFAGSVSSMLKNLTQNVNTVAEVGANWWARGLGGLARSADRALIREIGLTDAGFVAELNAAVDSGVKRVFRHTAPKVRDAMTSTMRASEWFNRSVAGLAAYKKMLARTGNVRRSREYARAVAARTQFDYAKGLGGLAYNGPVAQFFFQFARFPVYQMDYLMNLARRAAANDTASMAPGDRALVPAFQFAAAMTALNFALDKINASFEETQGPGAGVPDVVQLATQFGVEELAAARARGLGVSQIDARERARQNVVRPLGAESRARNPASAIGAFFGPGPHMVGDSLASWLSLDERGKMAAERRVESGSKLLFPGLQASRVIRALEELEGQIIRSRSGDPLVPITPADALMRAVGINSPNVQKQFEEFTDLKTREAAGDALSTRANAEIREMIRSGEELETVYAKFLRAQHDLEVETGKAKSRKEIRRLWKFLVNDVRGKEAEPSLLRLRRERQETVDKQLNRARIRREDEKITGSR